MSVEKAINNLINELRNHRGAGRGIDDPGSGRDSGPKPGKQSAGEEERQRQRKLREREREVTEREKNVDGMIANILKKGIFKGVQGAKDMMMAEIKYGITLDETDIYNLLDPINRQVQRLVDYKVESAVMFKEFGMTVEDLGTRFNTGRDEMENFGKESQRLYGNARTGYETYAKLNQNLGSFVAMNRDERMQIGLTAMAMEKLGFETKGVADVLDNSTRSLGMTAGEAMSSTMMLADLRKEFNMGAREITENYILAQNKLIYNSDKVTRVFADLQRTSRVSGVEFSTLVDKFGTGFDTFEDAAQKAGGLNALLGGNVFNSLELLEMDEAERVGTIVERIRGKVDVNALITDKFNLKAVANQLGLNEDQTRRLLLGETGVTEAMEKAIPSGAEAVKSANKNMVKALDDLQETFRLARGPFNNALQALADSLADATGKITGNLVSKEGVLGTQDKIRSIQLLKPSNEAFFDSEEDFQLRLNSGLFEQALTTAMIDNVVDRSKIPGTNLISNAASLGTIQLAAMANKLELVLGAFVAASAGNTNALETNNKITADMLRRARISAGGLNLDLGQ